MSHALATVLHRGRKAASNIMAACLASSREARWETGLLEVRSASPERGWAYSILNRVGCWVHSSGTSPSRTSARRAAWCCASRLLTPSPRATSSPSQMTSKTQRRR